MIRMRVFVIFVMILGLAENLLAQKSLIFQKYSSGEEILVALPSPCSFLTVDHVWQEGTVFDKTDSSFMWSYHFHDSLKFNEIVKDKTLSRKEKKMRTDSLYKADSVIVTTNFNDIVRMNFKVRAIKPTKYKKAMRTLLVVSQVMAVVVLVCVIYELIPLAQFAIPVYTATFISAILSTKKRIRLSKWKVRS